MLVKMEMVPSFCRTCGNPAKAHRIKGKRSWMESHLQPEPAAMRFWQYVASLDMNLAFCSQKCCTACVEKHRLDYLMYLTEKDDVQLPHF